MKGGKKAVGVVAVAIMVVMLIAAPTAMARLPRDIIPADGSLAMTPKAGMAQATLCYTGETCKHTICFSPACYCESSDHKCYLVLSGA
ncbi:unnamed protein product [Urochloa decumbens]|uniref:Uncharacterized protein n=1 Tax=Urochloa decumbens TaxID=240449 RepID=A0ABC9GCP1_9POAL